MGIHSFTCERKLPLELGHEQKEQKHSSLLFFSSLRKKTQIPKLLHVLSCKAMLQGTVGQESNGRHECVGNNGKF